MWYIAYAEDGKLINVINAETLDSYWLSLEQVLDMLKVGKQFYTIGSYTRVIGAGGTPTLDTYGSEFYDSIKYMKTLQINDCTNHLASDFVVDYEELILTYNNDFSAQSFRRTLYKYNTENLIIKEGIGNIYVYSFGVAYKVKLLLNSIKGIYRVEDGHIFVMTSRYGGCIKLSLSSSSAFIDMLGEMSRSKFLRKCILDWDILET